MTTDKARLIEKFNDRHKLQFPKSGGTGTDHAILETITMIDNDLRNQPTTMIVITDGRPPNLNAAVSVSVFVCLYT